MHKQMYAEQHTHTEYPSLKSNSVFGSKRAA